MEKKIKEMIESAFTNKQARNTLETYHIFGNVTEEEYKKGKDMIRKEFDKN